MTAGVSSGTSPAGPSTSRFAELRLEGVGRRYGAQTALEDFSLSIKGSEFVALLGPSGCGKSTALNCLAGLLPLTTGSIHLDDRRIDTLPPERRGFGMVFQNYALFPHMTVRKNIAFGLQMQKVARAEVARRVDEAVALVQLGEHQHKMPGQLSGGQQQRVAIARAIALHPPVVLMDEPLSNLDAKLRLEMRMEIRRLHQDLGLTTVYVTHDQEEALSMADRLVVLREGVIQQVGTPQEVYEQPVNSYVAGFMGYRNLIDVDVTGGDAEHAVVEGGGLRLTGANRGVRSGAAVAAIRPEDLVIGETDGNGIEVTVRIAEYHGRELSVEATTEQGRSIYFRTPERVAPGDRVVLGVPRHRVLVFGDASAAREAVRAGLES
ncbi:putative spermidine/putrescine transport system ATP-binding protein [Nocardioides terrae]|uniref:Putative spermidine/putrescine transport system ATP-binding protein n=1 Tax=Nocardioides terrae TaxID=574651 RepID=A0A1I1LA01_9ACTN|nr:ABC transporter ATP-binding protein [Nocardioides terrae]SFC67213.1 putative spermidine/putrescine transport system ATP-binding protein [Nocardioides terrae]